METIKLTPEQVAEAFRNVNLEENYNFLEEDLVKLANVFVEAATPAIIEAERQRCIEAARSVNHLVAERIAQIRSK